MPKKKTSENYDALGGIFDFIFKEAKKPKEKRKPLKLTGIAGDSMLTDALMSTLENPGTFLSGTVVDEFNGALELELGVVKFDEGGQVKITSNNAIDFLKDPKTFIDKQIQRNKATRKMQRAMYLGSAMDELLTTAWAHRYGNAEARAVALGAVTARHASESYKISRAMGEYASTHSGEGSSLLNVAIPGTKYAPDIEYMADRALTLIGRKTFGANWDTLSDSRKSEFARILSKEGIGGNKPTQANIHTYLTATYGAGVANRFVAATNGFLTVTPHGNANSTELNVYDPEFYKELEIEHLNGRITSLSGAPVGTAQDDERRMYQKTLYLLQRDRTALKAQITSLNTELASATSRDRRKALRIQIRDTKSALRNIGGHTLFGQVGKYEGYINSLNNVWGRGGENVLPSILNGDFFDGRKNTVLNPVTKFEVAGVEILAAKTLEDPSTHNERRLLNEYNKMGEKLYYFSPRVMFKTMFFNGEGFARLLKGRLDNIDALLGSLSQPMQARLNGLGITSGTIWKAISNGNINALDTYITNTLSQAQAVLSPTEYLKFEKLLKSSGRLRKITNATSIPYQIMGRMQNWIKDKLKLQKLRVKFARFLLKNSKIRSLLVKTGANKLIGQWIAGAGLKTLMQAIATTMVGALGLIASPLASVVITAVTWIATDLFLKVLGSFFVIVKYAILGLVGLFVLLNLGGLKSVGKFNSTNFAYSNAVPGSVQNCSLYSYGPVLPSQGSSVGLVYSSQCVGGESIQDIFNRVASQMGLGTQLELVTCPGHTMCASISWAWCYSADKIYCKADKLSATSCPVLEALFVHELVHQIQGSNAGGMYGTLLREWGADYISGNGGGYSFRTTSGDCIRASETSVSVCDANTLTSIAYSEASAYDTACRRALSNYIVDFCPRQ